MFGKNYSLCVIVQVVFRHKGMYIFDVAQHNFGIPRLGANRSLIYSE